MKCPCQVHSGVLATTLVLHCDSGRTSIKEIAKTLGLPAATVGTRLARGRERLRQMLKEDM